LFTRERSRTRSRSIPRRLYENVLLHPDIDLVEILIPYPVLERRDPQLNSSQLFYPFIKKDTGRDHPAMTRSPQNIATLVRFRRCTDQEALVMPEGPFIAVIYKDGKELSRFEDGLDRDSAPPPGGAGRLPRRRTTRSSLCDCPRVCEFTGSDHNS
jgi:hypothetical protein